MDNSWLRKELSEYKELYLCCEQEDALKYCTQSMVRMLNCLCEMNDTLFYLYERKMLWGAVQVFSKQCHLQIRKALACGKAEDKNKIIKLIQESIGDILTVYNNVFESAGGMNYQMVKGLSVNSDSHELSAKICTFFSSILDKLVEMFQEEGMEYAFILHPALQSIVQTKVLLDEKDVTGKVIIVYMPENVMEKFDLVSVCLMHEAFHVLTQQERNRKLRYEYFCQSTLLCIRFRIFEHIRFFEENETKNRVMQERLTRKWFSSLKETYFRNEPELPGGKRFYGERTKQELELALKQCLIEINKKLSSDLMWAAYQGEENVGYDVYLTRCEKVNEWVSIIRENIFFLLNGNVLKNILGVLMQMYRECYADISCIIMLSLDSGVYESAFEKSILFKYDKESYIDQDQILRARIVAEAVKDFVPEEIQDGWKNYNDELKEKYKNALTFKKNQDSKARQDTKSYVNITITSAAIDCYVKYLKECARMFSEKCKSIQGLPEFRKQINEVMRLGNHACLMRVLAGAVDIEKIVQEDQSENGK